MDFKLPEFFKQLKHDLDKETKEMKETLENSSPFSGTGNVSIQNSNGTTIVNRNGNLEITGKVRSLTVNGKTIDLTK